MTIQMGDEAIDFVLRDSSGTAYRLLDYRGHWVLLVFHRHLG